MESLIQNTAEGRWDGTHTQSLIISYKHTRAHILSDIHAGIKINKTTDVLTLTLHSTHTEGRHSHIQKHQLIIGVLSAIVYQNKCVFTNQFVVETSV